MYIIWTSLWLCFEGLINRIIDFGKVLIYFFSNGILTSITTAEQIPNTQVDVTFANLGATRGIKKSYFSFVIITLAYMISSSRKLAIFLSILLQQFYLVDQSTDQCKPAGQTGLDNLFELPSVFVE